MTDHAVSAADVADAAAAIRDDVVHTRSAHSRTLSAITGADVIVKFENDQFTGSFKDRGAANHLRSLSDDARANGVVAMSAGNHAQGVAYHAGRMGIGATIVMPAGAPFNKVVDTEALGAEVVLHGATLVEARAKLDELRDRHGYVFVPPFDDEHVIAGQGTVAVEMLADEPDLDVLVVPVGGGGLISGMAVAARALKPDIEIIGVQIGGFAPVATAFGHTDPTPDHANLDTLADGIAVKGLGELTFPLMERHVDDVVVVTEEMVEQAIGTLIEVEKTVVEGAGAVPLAAMVADRERFLGRRVGLVLSGGNIDVRVLASVLMRGMVRTDRISTLRIELEDLPGQLAPVVTSLAAAGANIVEIDHRRLFDPISARHTNIDVVVETRDAGHRDAVVTALAALGHRVEILH